MDQKLLNDAIKNGTPVVRGNQVVFLWQGETAPELIGDFNGWEDGTPTALTRVKKGFWAYSLELPEDAYIEYIFWKDGERVFDPLSRRKTSNGMGKFNHFFYMPKGMPTPFVYIKKGMAKGKITHSVSPPTWLFAGKRRTIHYYQPPVDTPSPLVVVFDGKDYLQRARLPQMVDQLIAQSLIEPIALAMVDNGRMARGVEYMCSEATLGALLETILPEARRLLNLVDIEQNPGCYGVLGASMGGLMALYTGLRIPQVFGKVLSQSGAFFSYGLYESIVWDLARQVDPGSIKIWQDVGRYEWLLEPNRRMASVLQERGFSVGYDEFNAGHNYPAWRNNLHKGLIHLFGKK